MNKYGNPRVRVYRARRECRTPRLGTFHAVFTESLKTHEIREMSLVCFAVKTDVILIVKRSGSAMFLQDTGFASPVV